MRSERNRPSSAAPAQSGRGCIGASPPRLRQSRTASCAIYAHDGENSMNLGVLMPEDGRTRLSRRIPISAFSFTPDTRITAGPDARRRQTGRDGSRFPGRAGISGGRNAEKIGRRHAACDRLRAGTRVSADAAFSLLYAAAGTGKALLGASAGCGRKTGGARGEKTVDKYGKCARIMQ